MFEIRIPKVTLIQDFFTHLDASPVDHGFVREIYDKFIIDFPVIDKFFCKHVFTQECTYLHGEGYADIIRMEAFRKLSTEAEKKHPGKVFRFLDPYEERDPLYINVNYLLVVYDIKIEHTSGVGP